MHGKARRGAGRPWTPIPSVFARFRGLYVDHLVNDTEPSGQNARPPSSLNRPARRKACLARLGPLGFVALRSPLEPLESSHRAAQEREQSS
jgi:hypothetical protein